MPDRTPPHPAIDDERAAPPRAPQRVMQVIAALAASRDGLTLTQMSDALELPKTSLFSLLRSLEAGGYVISENGHHRLGQETHSLAAMIRNSDGFPGNVRAWLMQLHRDCEETVMVGVPADDWTHLVYVDVIEATSWLRYSANVGAHRPLYSTSLGLAMLAFATPEQQRHYLEKTVLTRITAHTITGKKALAQEFQNIRARGHVVSSGSIEGATGISAPVFGSGGGLAAAVGLAGLTVRCERNAERFAALTLACGERMSRTLGYAGPYPKAVAGGVKPR